jgi:hypothetical protein
MFAFVSGLITMGFFVSGLFFIRFWIRTRDLLFAAFAAAFWLLATNQALLALSDLPVEERSWMYLLRLAAFIIIILAIALKNRRAL